MVVCVSDTGSERWSDSCGARVRRTTGALTIASTVIRKSLDRLKNVVSDAEPFETVFPRYVPFCHGREYHRNLCKILDAEINKKER